MSLRRSRTRNVLSDRCIWSITMQISQPHIILCRCVIGFRIFIASMSERSAVSEMTILPDSSRASGSPPPRP